MNGQKESYVRLGSPESELTGEMLTEAPRRTPVVRNVDVVVCGAGPAGTAAALAASREGASVLLIERHGMLGGMWTASLMNPLFQFRQGWILDDIIAELKGRNAWMAWNPWKGRGERCFDPEVLKTVLEQMMHRAGVEFWYHSQVVDPIVEGAAVRGVLVESKSGREAIIAKSVVDCTGDGDVAARAGVPFTKGRPVDGICQPMTLMFELAGLGEYEQTSSTHLFERMTEAIEQHDLGVELPWGPGRSGTPWVIHIPRSRCAVVQATHVYRFDATDTRDLTRATVKARRQAWQLLRVLRHVPGLENASLTQTGPSIGVRETRHLAGGYHLTHEDLESGRRFEDGVVSCTFGCDIHEIYPGDKHRFRCDVQRYEIPYRCMTPSGLDGLLFAGRCISGSHEAHASYRVTGTCFGMGQAAGLAAAEAAQTGLSVRHIDGVRLRADLEERGVRFDW